MNTALKIFVLAFLAAGVPGIPYAQVRQYSARAVEEYPHDVTSYTQGLFFVDGQMYESTGQNGSSTFRKVELGSGKPLRRLDFNRKYFVEGSSVLGDRLYILTWTNRVAFVYSFPELEYVSTVSYPRQGWGLTTDGESLIASDGSSSLYYMTPDLRVTKTLQVRLHGKPLDYLNELEYIDGKIWANVYGLDEIFIIDPVSGQVTGKVDCRGLLDARYRTAAVDVLNGIAWNSADGSLYLTGKYWPRMYKVTIKEK